jgi:hypothetical protein
MVWTEQDPEAEGHASVRKGARAHTQTDTHINIYTNTQAYTHTHTRTHTYTCTYIHTYIHDVGQHFTHSIEKQHTRQSRISIWGLRLWKYWSHLLALSPCWRKRLLALSCLSISPSVIPTVRIEQLGCGSHWTNFHEIWYSRIFIFRKYALKVHVSLKYGKDKGGHCTCTPT